MGGRGGAGSGGGASAGGGKAGGGGKGSIAGFLASGGLRGKDISGGMPFRPESFAHLRAGKAIHGGIPSVTVYADGRPVVQDGRHRITIARERGDKFIEARVTELGPRGGVRRVRVARVPI